MSKLLSLGMPLADVIRAGTVAPARAVRRTDLGHFTPGAVGDATIIDLAEGAFTYRDVLGETREGRLRLSASGLVVGGKYWEAEK
jgi:dihydroorotase